jgi:nitrile hydratase beta subunit-like protein
MKAGAVKFNRGDRVKVRFEDGPGHIRTPWYIRGKTGRIESIHGEFLNPESLGHGGDGLPRRPLYLVAFRQCDVWEKYHAPDDKLLVDIFEHWLEPVY